MPPFAENTDFWNFGWVKFQPIDKFRMKTVSFSIFCRFQCTNIEPGFFQKHVYMLLLVVSNFKCTLFKYRKISISKNWGINEHLETLQKPECRMEKSQGRRLGESFKAMSWLCTIDNDIITTYIPNAMASGWKGCTFI